MAKKSNAPSSGEKLKSYVDRIVRLSEEIASLKDDVKDIVAEAKNDGFDPKALKAIVKETMQTQTQRAAARKTEAIIDIYRANLGLLDGTPLGDAARRRYEREMREARDESESNEKFEADGSSGIDPDMPTVEEANEQGRSDHLAGKRVVDNPFPAGSANRAAWDEGWCASDGSDGMDLPKAWRRSEAKQPEAAE